MDASDPSITRYTFSEPLVVRNGEELRYEITEHGIENARVVPNIESHIDSILRVVGADDDMTEEMWQNTPRRTASWLREYAHDKPVTLDEVLQPRFPEVHNELVMVRNISFSSLCAHHMLPFVGTATVGYLPNGTVVGLSKLARAVQHVAQRLTLQERITQQLADGIYSALNPHGVVVIVEANHLCMQVRGVRDPHVETVTMAQRGQKIVTDMGQLL